MVRANQVWNRILASIVKLQNHALYSRRSQRIQSLRLSEHRSSAKIMATFKFEGGDKLKAHLKKLSKKVTKASVVEVGFFEGKNYSNGTSIAMVAAIQEFGAPAKGIPPRPFFRNMIKKEEGHWGNDVAALLKSTDYDAAKTLGFMGEEIEGELKQSIVDLTEPQLSDVTLLLRERFGNNPQEITFADVTQARQDIAAGIKPNVSGTQAKPLVWTGALLGSTTYKVK